MRRLLPALLLALAVTLTGCFEIASTLTVRPDGSAELRDRVRLSGLGAQALQESADGTGGVDKRRLQARAAALGEGVSLVAVEETETGFEAVYHVRDVRTLRFTVPDLPLGDDDGDTTVADAALGLTFGFEPGAPATLRIIVPETAAATTETGASEPTEAERAEAERGLRIVRSLLGDAHVTVAVELEGDVVETDAAYAEGGRITLYDIGFDAVFDALEERPDLMRRDTPPTDQLQALLDGHEGVRIQTPGTVTVRFD